MILDCISMVPVILALHFYGSGDISSAFQWYSWY